MRRKYGKYDRRSQKIINFRVDENIRERFKQRCEKNGKSMQFVLEDLIGMYIEKT